MVLGRKDKKILKMVKQTRTHNARYVGVRKKHILIVFSFEGGSLP